MHPPVRLRFFVAWSGYRPVPHVPVSRISTMDEFEQTLEMLRQALRLQLRGFKDFKVIELECQGQSMSRLQSYSQQPCHQSPSFSRYLYFRTAKDLAAFAVILHLLRASTQLLSIFPRRRSCLCRCIFT